MARNFPDFLSAYFSYARDGFAPDRFHRWVGLSLIAAALERKVTLKQGRIHHVPNIYVMLVSPPAVGKSTAIEAGTNLLEEMKKLYKPEFKIIPNQATEPAFIDLMKIIDAIPIGPTQFFTQSAGYFYASEASASALQNTCGDFIASMTHFYDCPRYFRKKLKGEKDTTEIENGCMNLLAGSTFNYLKTLVNEQSVLGGFASRLIYIVHEERSVKETHWETSQDLDSTAAKKLIEDLAHINQIIGPMKPTAGFISCWEEWKPKFDQFLIDLKSERLEAIMSRKGTNLIKVSMLLSISESDSRIVTEEHFFGALELIEDAYKDNAQILASAVMSSTETQKGTTQLILQTIKKMGGVADPKVVRKIALLSGNPVSLVDETLKYMLENDVISYDSNTGRYTLNSDPNRYL